MYINYYKTYLQTIRNSLGSKIYTSFFVDETDILHEGSVACAYYVSNILKQFNLTSVGRARVVKVIDDLRAKGWKEMPITTPAEAIAPGNILVRETAYGETYDTMHYHIGFYMGDEQAISNNSISFTGMQDAGYVPVQHHRTYNGQRKLTHIFARDWEDTCADWLLHHEREIPFVCGTNEKVLENDGFTLDERIFWLGKNESLRYGKLCGAACACMSAQYFSRTAEKNISLHTCIEYANQSISYTDAKTGEEKKTSCYVPGIGRYHSGLIWITQKVADIPDSSFHSEILSISPDTIRTYACNTVTSKEKGVLLISVTPGFSSTHQHEKQGGHLVVVTGVSYNGYEKNLIIHDPIEESKSVISLSVCQKNFSGKAIHMRVS